MFAGMGGMLGLAMGFGLIGGVGLVQGGFRYMTSWTATATRCCWGRADLRAGAARDRRGALHPPCQAAGPARALGRTAGGSSR